ncbi:hypothetical protein B0H14DRAFT_2628566 [Mycena olivaceomarginata]|nr:hypothetical protein B0H14DRAFT_2628566 [Mycena olivaceomarginata]
MRGGRITQAKRSRRAGGRATAVTQDDDSDANTIDPALDDNRVSTSATKPSDTADAGESDALETVAIEIDHLDLSESELRALQVLSTKAFRAVCNVGASEEWPDDPSTVRRNKVTGEIYPSPYFQFNITHPKNQSVCLQVAKQVIQDLQCVVLTSSSGYFGGGVTWEANTCRSVQDEHIRDRVISNFDEQQGKKKCLQYMSLY